MRLKRLQQSRARKAQKRKTAARLRVKRTGRRKLSQLLERAAVIRELGPKSPVYAANPALQAACSGVGAAADSAKTCESNSKVADQEAEAKRVLLESSVGSLADAISLYDIQVEQSAGSAAAAEGLGATVLVATSYALVSPRGMTVKVIHTLPGSATLRVQRAAGLPTCYVEISHDGGLTYTEALGEGATRNLKGLAPGNYLARACHQRRGERSAFTAPVSFTIR